MRTWIGGALAAAVVAAWPGIAHADITAFLGVSPTPESRLARGLAAGSGLVVVGFEIEVARLAEDTAAGVPGLTTGMAQLLVQTPLEVSRMQLYGTTGLGLYRERLGDETETALAGSLGGGAKIRLAGPLKLRLDYRLFRLRGDPRHDVYQRVYGGVTLGF